MAYENLFMALWKQSFQGQCPFWGWSSVGIYQQSLWRLHLCLTNWKTCIKQAKTCEIQTPRLPQLKGVFDGLCVHLSRTIAENGIISRSGHSGISVDPQLELKSSSSSWNPLGFSCGFLCSFLHDAISRRGLEDLECTESSTWCSELWSLIFDQLRCMLQYTIQIILLLFVFLLVEYIFNFYRVRHT